MVKVCNDIAKNINSFYNGIENNGEVKRRARELCLRL